MNEAQLIRRKRLAAEYRQAHRAQHNAYNARYRTRPEYAEQQKRYNANQYAKRRLAKGGIKMDTKTNEWRPRTVITPWHSLLGCNLKGYVDQRVREGKSFNAICDEARKHFLKFPSEKVVDLMLKFILSAKVEFNRESREIFLRQKKVEEKKAEEKKRVDILLNPLPAPTPDGRQIIGQDVFITPSGRVDKVSWLDERVAVLEKFEQRITPHDATLKDTCPCAYCRLNRMETRMKRLEAMLG